MSAIEILINNYDSTIKLLRAELAAARAEVERLTAILGESLSKGIISIDGVNLIEENERLADKIIALEARPQMSPIDELDVRWQALVSKWYQTKIKLFRANAHIAELESAQEWHKASEPPDKCRPVLLCYLNEWKKKRIIIAQYARGKDLELDFDCDPWEGCFWDEEEQQYYCSEGWYHVTECEDVEYNVVGTKLGWRDLPPMPSGEGEK